ALGSDNYAPYFEQAQKVRTLVINEFKTIFQHYDLIIGPTTPTPAYKIGLKHNDPTVTKASDVITVTANLAGLPGLSLPCGFTEEEGLPLGLQIIGNYY